MKTLYIMPKFMLTVMILTGLSLSSIICAGQGNQNKRFLQSIEPSYSEASGGGSTSTFSIYEEKTVEIETWMFESAESNWLNKRAEVEIDNWMLDVSESNWSSVDTIVAEKDLNVQDWMIDLNSWIL